jgi:hypothetical protein
MSSAGLAAAASLDAFLITGFPYAEFDQLPATPIVVGSSILRVGFAPGPIALPRERILGWIKKSAEAVSAYYGHFPVAAARVLIVPAAGKGIKGGQAFGYRGPAIRLIVGRDSSEADLIADWKAVHEMVHLALPDVPEEHLWLAEGLAVYVESIARVQAGDLTPEKIWGDFVRDMPRGLPEEGDRGLDETHTWGRTYWGGAIFYLMADVEIRKRTGNKLGLQQAMRGVVAAGGTHDQDWTIEKILKTADAATGTDVMSTIHRNMGSKPYDPDLPKLWNELGINDKNGIISFNDQAPLASIRRAITAREAAPQ